MYHNRGYRKLGRKHSHRLATLRALSTALFRRERIQTTLMKAKDLRSFAEKIITRGKQDDLHSRRIVARDIQDKDVAKKLFDTLSPRYIERPGGYMRIFKLGRRKGDGAEMALVELLGSEPDFGKKEDEKKAAVAGRKKSGLASRILGGRKKKAAEGAQTAEAAEAASPAPSERAPVKREKSKTTKSRTAHTPRVKAPKGDK